MVSPAPPRSFVCLSVCKITKQVALLSQRDLRDASCMSVASFVASIVQYLGRSFFIISYFSFVFTSAYNSILFCCLRRNVKPCCHTHDLS